jgi:hypothetical protein
MESWDDRRTLDLVRKCLAQELDPKVSLPSDEDDLVQTELIDSMSWVGLLTAIEAATGIHNFGNPWPETRPQSICALAEAILERSAELGARSASHRTASPTGGGPIVSVAGWGYALGSRLLQAAEIERHCSLASGTIRDRAGIESVRQAGENEDEVALAQQAVDRALETAGVDIADVNLLVATSTTFLRLPSLAATLHSRLLLPESSGALDVGGACVGVIQALATAKALLAAGQSRLALVVASEVPSRRLASSSAPGDFRGLFGDGACAFVLSRSRSAGRRWKLGEFVWGCSGAFAASLRLELAEASPLRVEFQGEAHLPRPRSANWSGSLRTSKRSAASPAQKLRTSRCTSLIHASSKSSPGAPESPWRRWPLFPGPAGIWGQPLAELICAQLWLELKRAKPPRLHRPSSWRPLVPDSSLAPRTSCRAIRSS